MCNKDCFNCQYDDCIIEIITQDEINEQNEFDRNTKDSLPDNYSKQYRYNHSEKGKEAQKRYAKSQKGIENNKRKQDKRIQSGRNAEACKRYRENLKERKAIIEQLKKEEKRQKNIARCKAYYRKKKLERLNEVMNYG